MKNILVPTEFTYLSECALKLGLEMAKLADAEIDIVSVIQPLYNNFMDENERYSHDPTSSLKNITITEEARQRMHARAEEIAQWLPDKRIAPKILYGDKVTSLLNEISAQIIDLVIMGGDLYDPKADFQANEFLQRSRTPVVVLKCMVNGLEKFKDIILLVDVQNDSRDMINHLKELQQLLDAKLHLLRVNTPKNFLSPKNCEASLESYAIKHNFSDFKTISLDARNEVEGLMSYAETIDNAFIALGIHDRGFVESLLTNRNKQEEIIANSVHPVWTLKD